MKKCRLCEKVLVTADFYKTRTECKKCTNSKNNDYRDKTGYNTEYYHKNKEREKARRIQDYYKDKEDPEKRLKWRGAQLKRKYGITIDDFNDQLEQQDYRCAICLTDESIGNGHFHVDHDHKTGKIRGLLCHHCNVALGSFKDSVETMEKAIDYLKNGGVLK